jgi:hypothetical protein
MLVVLTFRYTVLTYSMLHFSVSFLLYILMHHARRIDQFSVHLPSDTLCSSIMIPVVFIFQLFILIHCVHLTWYPSQFSFKINPPTPCSQHSANYSSVSYIHSHTPCSDSMIHFSVHFPFSHLTHSAHVAWYLLHSSELSS